MPYDPLKAFLGGAASVLCPAFRSGKRPNGWPDPPDGERLGNAIEAEKVRFLDDGRRIESDLDQKAIGRIEEALDEARKEDFRKLRLAARLSFAGQASALGLAVGSMAGAALLAEAGKEGAALLAILPLLLCVLTACAFAASETKPARKPPRRNDERRRPEKKRRTDEGAEP